MSQFWGQLQFAHIILALGEDSLAVRNALPSEIANQNWPPAWETSRIEHLVRDRLSKCPQAISDCLSQDEANRISLAFMEEANLPEALSLQSVIAYQSQHVDRTHGADVGGSSLFAVLGILGE